VEDNRVKTEVRKTGTDGPHTLTDTVRYHWHHDGYRALRVVTSFRFLPSLYARVRGALSTYPLPPGDLIRLDERERADRLVLLKQANQVGPIFKAVSGRRLVTCMVGLAHCRRFLKEHHDRLTPATVKLESLFPRGFLRQMKGEEHRHYRTALGRALDPEAPIRLAAAFRNIARDALADYADHRGATAPSPAALERTLSTIATGMLMRAFFGVRYGSDPYRQLAQGFEQLGPQGFEWFIGRRQRKAFAALRDNLAGMAASMGSSPNHWMRDSILGRTAGQDALDETMLGNLIYMVEMGRFDMASLFRWICKYLGHAPAVQHALREATPPGEDAHGSLHQAVVLETLRLNQIERLMRVVDRDIVFEGYLLPRFSLVRLCLWEAHKAPDTFPDPFAFRPERFLNQTCSRDAYAPFGLHHHSCPLADFSVRMSMVVVDELTRPYTVEAVDDGPAYRSRYHWQPAPSFTVRLRR
jgi:cytochrome P450